MQLPFFRLGVQDSAGSGTCGGAVSYTLADLIAHGSGGAQVVPGAVMNCQTWGRDAGDAYGTSLSNALQFIVAP